MFWKSIFQNIWKREQKWWRTFLTTLLLRLFKNYRASFSDSGSISHGAKRGGREDLCKERKRKKCFDTFRGVFCKSGIFVYHSQRIFYSCPEGGLRLYRNSYEGAGRNCEANPRRAVFKYVKAGFGINGKFGQ